MAALIDAIEVKRKMFFEFENTPYRCMDATVKTPTARGGQSLVHLSRLRIFWVGHEFYSCRQSPELIRALAPEAVPSPHPLSSRPKQIMVMICVVKRPC